MLETHCSHSGVHFEHQSTPRSQAIMRVVSVNAHIHIQTQFNKHRQSFPSPQLSLTHTHTQRMRTIRIGIPFPKMLMTLFPFLWRQCSVAVVIWILMADTLHWPAACFEPHNFAYVENHIKMNYYRELAKSNMWCEERGKKHQVSHFKVVCPWMLF